MYLVKLQRHLIKSKQIRFPDVTVCQKVKHRYSFYRTQHEEIAGEDIKMSAIVWCHRPRLVLGCWDDWAGAQCAASPCQLAAGKPPRLEPLGARAGKKMLPGYVDSFKTCFSLWCLNDQLLIFNWPECKNLTLFASLKSGIPWGWWGFFFRFFFPHVYSVPQHSHVSPCEMARFRLWWNWHCSFGTEKPEVFHVVAMESSNCHTVCRRKCDFVWLRTGDLPGIQPRLGITSCLID